jgi:elongation factor Ts
MPVTPLMVKELREKTGAGMLDCKKALEASDCDMEAAITWLREKGIAKAEKKASRVAAEGLCSVEVSGNNAVVFEVNSETDFVAQNEKFTSLLAKVGNIIVNSEAKCTDCALNIDVEGKKLSEIILEASGTIGEKLSLRRVSRVVKTDSQVFGAYKHMGGKIVTLVLLNGNDGEAARDVAMHIAAINPKYVSKNDISAEEVSKEREILLAQALNENAEAAKPKPEAIIAKMVEGRLNKNLQEICLLNQPFVKNPDQTVEAFVKSKGCEVVSFVRLAVGEGIEKEVVDFAAEVAAQAGLNK